MGARTKSNANTKRCAPSAAQSDTYMKHELFEELEAWHPHWRKVSKSLRDAAEQAGVMDLYLEWLGTQEGAKYLQTFAGTPDYLGAVKAAQESAERLPFSLSNLGTERT